MSRTFLGKHGSLSACKSRIIPGFHLTVPAGEHRDETGRWGLSSNPSLATDKLCSIGKVT